MKFILLKAFIVSTLAVVAAYAMIITLIPLFGEKINPSAWFLGFVGPFLIGMPVGSFCFWQADKLKAAHMQLIEAHDTLRKKSRRDHMTGMLNRETFMAQMVGLNRKSDTGVLLIADADHFKRINDCYGHLDGDKALLMISQAIESAVRDGDMAGRIGGEEFAVFLTGADIDEAEIVAERMRIAVEAIKFHTSCGTLVPLTISAGGVHTSGRPNMSELMRCADRCLYEAKRSGRNRVILNREFQQAA